MIPGEFTFDVAAANGRPQRLVSIAHANGTTFRDHINTNSGMSRQRLIARAAHKFRVDESELRWVDDAIVEVADRADDAVDEAAGDESDHKSTADLLVDLALANYRIGRTETDEPFAVAIDGPNVALMFRGSRDALRSTLSREFRRLHGRTPNSAALSDALTALQGEAYAAESEPVHLRVAEQDGAIVIDLGDSAGRAVIVTPAGWRVTERSPVLFRRTAATGALPVPQQRGELAELRSLVNISSETWPLVVGWLVAALVPNVPHPILLLGGQQGSGKTTAARSLVGLIDPSPAQLRSQPRDPETWAISASASWVVAVDNISTISVWWSDSLCKAVTGDGWLRRKLYTDGDLAVLSFRRVVLLTSIDPGALRGDLGARVLLVDLEPIDETARQTDRDLAARYEAARPRILGAILDLLVRVMAELANVQLERHPRMADFGRLLAAVDRAADNADNRALEIYVGQVTRIAETVIESDPVALAIESLMEEEGHWEGTAGQLLASLTPERPPKDWPRTPQGMGGRLKRLIPALKQAGIRIEQDRAGHERTRLYHITRCPADGEGNPSSATSALSAGGENCGKPVTSTRTSADDCGQPDGGDCPPETAIAAGETWRADDADDLFRSSSGGAVSARPASLRGLCSGRLSSEEVRPHQERERPSRPTIGTGESGHED